MRPAVSFKSSLVVVSVSLALAAACGSGDAGPAGAAGAAGPAGAQGAQGDAGAAGAGLTDGDGGLLFLTLSERARRGFDIVPVPLNLTGKTAAEIEQIGVGSYFANSMAECSSCHTPQSAPGQPLKYFAGGTELPLGPEGEFVVARNLTPDPATGLKDTLEQFIQASRNGTDILNQGKPLRHHPWQHHRWLSTSDLTAIYAFLQVIPPINNAYRAGNKPALSVSLKEFDPKRYTEGAVDRPLPPELDFEGKPIPDPDFVLRGLAIVPLDVAPPTEPHELALYGRGSYIINAAAGCSSCHTNPARANDDVQSVNTAQYFRGGFVIPAGPQLAPFVRVQRSMSANLVGKAHGYFNTPGMNFATFLKTITQGVHATKADNMGNAPPLAFPMPYKEFRLLTVTDLEAVYTYFKWIADKIKVGDDDFDKETQPAARYCGPIPGGPDATCLAGETCTANECIGGSCSGDLECGACQTCDGTGHCAAPVGFACIAFGK